MGYRSCQSNMPHSFPADFRLNNFYSALFANHSTVLHPFITPAKAFIVLNRSKNLCTEKSISFRFKCPVVDGFRFLYFAMRPRKNLVRRRYGNLHCIESDRIFWFFKITENVFHRFSPVPLNNYMKFLSYFHYTSFFNVSIFTCAKLLPAASVSLMVSTTRNYSSSTNSTSNPRLWSSLTKTLKDSGNPGSNVCSPLTIDS